LIPKTAALYTTESRINTKNHGIRYQFLCASAEIWRLVLFSAFIDTNIAEIGIKSKSFQCQKAAHSQKGTIMTDSEKKLIQAKHRLEEAQARDRVKQRKARTRRLIQEGATMEKALPQTAGMELDELEIYLRRLTN